MPPGMQMALVRVRQKLEQNLASTTVKASTVSLEAIDRTMAHMMSQIEEQTGNKIRDDRPGVDDTQAEVTLSVDDKFWPAMDLLMDRTQTSIYPYGGKGVLALVGRSPGEEPRFGRASYDGPFRFEVLRVTSKRGLRNTNNKALELDLEICWEPRIEPIALSHPLSQLEVTSKSGVRLSPLRPEQEIDVEVSPGSQVVEMTLSLILPDRSTRVIQSTKGMLHAIIPGRIKQFRFDKLSPTRERETIKYGPTEVTLERFFKNNAVWELQMRMKLDDPGDALASHRGWVFNNLSYLEDPTGKRYEYVALETTLQTDNEIGVAYLFDFIDEATGEPLDVNVEELTWVYESPIGVFDVPVKYELGPIELP